MSKWAAPTIDEINLIANKGNENLFW